MRFGAGAGADGCHDLEKADQPALIEELLCALAASRSNDSEWTLLVEVQQGSKDTRH